MRGPEEALEAEAGELGGEPADLGIAGGLFGLMVGLDQFVPAGLAVVIALGVTGAGEGGDIDATAGADLVDVSSSLDDEVLAALAGHGCTGAGVSHAVATSASTALYPDRHSLLPRLLANELMSKI